MDLEGWAVARLPLDAASKSSWMPDVDHTVGKGQFFFKYCLSIRVIYFLCLCRIYIPLACSVLRISTLLIKLSVFFMFFHQTFSLNKTI